MSKPTGGKDFEERLLGRLKAVVAQRGAAAADPGAPSPASARPRRRRPLRLALAGAAALAVAAVVLVVSSGGNSTSRAFAVEPQQGGGVTIKIYSLEDTAGLERALKHAGIPAQVSWLPAGTTCRERRLTSATVKTSMGASMSEFDMGGRGQAMTIGAMTPQQYRDRVRAVKRAVKRGALSTEEAGRSIPSISFDPGSFSGDQTVVISGSPIPYGGDPEGGYEAQLRVVEGPVEPCEPVTSPAPSIGAIKVPEGTESTPTEPLPAAGQLLYTKTKVVQLEGWEPDGRGAGAQAKAPRFTTNLLGPAANALPAFVPTTKEVWTAADGKTRVRETLGRIEFLAAADQRRWEAAGSPPPSAYDPAGHHVGRDASGAPTKEYASRSWRGGNVFVNVPKLAALPTEAEALRLAIEGRSDAGAASAARSRRGRMTADRLLEILGEPISSPALRAAAFDALAEIPGIELEHGVTDVAGRRGDAITWNRGRGFGEEVIFDHGTSRVLAQAEMIFGPPSTGEYGVPAGTAFEETANLGSKIVGR